MPEPLRVIDFGETTPLRSQTLWHAVAHGVDRGEPPTLSFVRTVSPYVSIGFHRSLEELDQATCQRHGWPVLRRQVGGGPVYMDRHQLCFQISVPAQRLPRSRPKAVQALLEPAIEAFRAAGLDARLDSSPEVVVGDRKVCGHAAAQIGTAVVLVGNLIEHFDHRAAASILKAPDATETEETWRLMRRYVAFEPGGPTVDARAFTDSAIAAYARALGATPVSGRLAHHELDDLSRLDRRFEDPSWLAAGRQPGRPVWRAKITNRVWRYFSGSSERRVGLSVVDGQIRRARVEGCGDDASVARALTGCHLSEATRSVAALGEAGSRAAEAVEELVAAGRPDWS